MIFCNGRRSSYFFYRLQGYIILHPDCVLICLILWKRQSINKLVFTAYCFLLLF